MGTIIFILLIGSAFALGWIFGVGFVISFILANINKVIEKKPLIPIFLFIGALIMRYALFALLPPILNSAGYFDLGISLILFLMILILGYKFKKGI